MTVPADGNAVREQVSQAYAAALEQARRQEGGGCCSSAVPVGVAAQTAGYSDEEKQAFLDAAQSSFGCGNPLAFAGVEEGQTVLDLGSGAGFDLLIASQKVGPAGKVIGVDMTEEMLEAARKNAESAGVKNIELRKGTIEELPVEDASVDWVISNCVINLSPEKPKVFAEIARVLKPGGHFSVSDIVAEDLPQTLRDAAAAYSACIGGAISEREYVGGLRSAGLSEIEVTERSVYDEAQLMGMVGTDLEALGVPKDLLDAQIPAVVGKVWSAKICGAKR
jgi:ubiquinone/menaquinone biosynthesis C-methylase UbiE